MAGTEQKILGGVGIFLGIIIYVLKFNLFMAAIPTILGIALIIFSNAESKIEKRRDK